MNQVNEHLIKITGSIPIEQELALDQDVIIRLEGSVVAVDERSNQDGSCDRYYKIKCVEAEIL